jgi:hypothetical protein
MARGTGAIGNTAAPNPLTIDTNSTTAGLPGGDPAIVISGDVNYEKFMIRSTKQPTFTGQNSAGSVSSPTATTPGKILFSLAGGGHDGTAWTAANPVLISMTAEETFSTTARGANILFATTAPGTTNRLERMRIAGSGNVGIGTNAPTQKLEVAGGVRVNSTGTKPACTDTTRGTFWFTNGGTTADDTMEVCAKVDGTPVWKPLW